MPKFRNKPKVIDAEQFTSEAIPPRGVRPFGAGFFAVTTMQGQNVLVQLGEWIVAESDGKHYYPIADGEFQRLYEFVIPITETNEALSC